MMESKRRIGSLPIVEGALSRLAQGEGLSIGSLVGSSPALLLTLLRKSLSRPLLFIAAHPRTADAVFDDLQFFGGAEAMLFPVLDSMTEEGGRRQSFYTADRQDLIRALHNNEAGIIVSSVQALLQGVPAFEDMSRSAITLRQGQTQSMDDLRDWLADRGFETTDMVESPGEMSLRGGILDVYDSPSRPPIRLEFFGDSIESIREFSPGTQISTRTIDTITLSSPLPTRNEPQELHSLMELLPDTTLTLCFEMHEIQQEANRTHLFTHFNWKDIEPQLARRQSCLLSSFPLVATDNSLNLPLQSTTRFHCGVDRLAAELTSLSAGESVEICCQNTAERDRLRDILKQEAHDELQALKISFTIGQIHNGFRAAECSYTLVASHELLRRKKMSRRVTQRRSTAPVASFYELQEGDLVVHVNYGIGRFLGMKQMHQNETSREFFQLEYRDGAKLYVPVTNIELLQKYIGGRDGQVDLDRIGSAAWKKRKAQVALQLQDMADELVQTQALREVTTGVSYPADDHWQVEFEAQFPYVETPDQLRAVEEIKADLNTPRPMDRLLCGDVGFGKTEVAMRAAFKVVNSGKQVGILVPTTILAQQHFRNFTERMAAYPIAVEYVSRFKTPKQNKETVQDTCDGLVDILIGTHRILSDDVQFKNLGLLIIDEEQRFGVAHKEKLKSLKANVDILTLSATPIPRTLHQSLVGIKSISTLHTPPADRIAVHTEILAYDRSRIRAAIQYELERGGQIFFVHNRVKDIETLAAELQALVPEASLMVAHGQMESKVLEERIQHFLEGGSDILLATTIIENGVDMPNVNTLFVNNATHFGLSELHQLRGRVGRDKYRAYAYFLLPDNEFVPPQAMRRLRAIEEYNELGAGYKIAMRDLELRGTGNLLGMQQSGHIKNIGYDLYCRLLKRALDEAARHNKGQAKSAAEQEELAAEFQFDVKLDTCIPQDYIASLTQRIGIYRKIAAAESASEISNVRAEITDRFGKPPAVIQTLFDLTAMRRCAVLHGISRVMVEDGNLVFLVTNFQSAAVLFRQVQDRCNLASQSKLILYLRPKDKSKKATMNILKKVLLNP